MSEIGDIIYLMQAHGLTTGKFNALQCAEMENKLNDSVRVFNKQQDNEEKLKALLGVLFTGVAYGLSQGWEMEQAWVEYWRMQLDRKKDIDLTEYL